MVNTLWIALKRSLRGSRLAQVLYGAWLRHRGRRRFKQDLREFTDLSAAHSRFSISKHDLYPCLADNTASTYIDRHYVYHTAWAARVLAQINPEQHVDISSYVFFNTIISAFIPVKFYDYRPVALGLDGLSSSFADLTSLPFEDGSIPSLSCMHVVEHIGLGRYGDPLDPAGDLKAIAELKRVLAPGGDLLFVVPVGTPRIQFNAHRIYAFGQIASHFLDLDLVEFSLIPDAAEQGGLIRHAADSQVSGLEYGCGCFHFRKQAH